MDFSNGARPSNGAARNAGKCAAKRKPRKAGLLRPRMAAPSDCPRSVSSAAGPRCSSGPGELSRAEKFQRRSQSAGGGGRTPAFAASRSPQRLAGGCSGSRSVGFYHLPLRAREGLAAAFRAALRGAPRRRGCAVRSARKAITRALRGASPPRSLALASKRLPRE